MLTNPNFQPLPTTARIRTGWTPERLLRDGWAPHEGGDVRCTAPGPIQSDKQGYLPDGESMMRGEVELKPSTIIAALEKRIAELEERVAALEKKKPAPAARKVTKEFVDRMVEKYADAPITVEAEIQAALNHKTSKTWLNVERGVQTWLNRAVRWAIERENPGRARRGRPVTDHKASFQD